MGGCAPWHVVTLEGFLGFGPGIHSAAIVPIFVQDSPQQQSNMWVRLKCPWASYITDIVWIKYSWGIKKKKHTPQMGQCFTSE